MPDFKKLFLILKKIFEFTVCNIRAEYLFYFNNLIIHQDFLSQKT